MTEEMASLFCEIFALPQTASKKMTFHFLRTIYFLVIIKYIFRNSILEIIVENAEKNRTLNIHHFYRNVPSSHKPLEGKVQVCITFAKRCFSEKPHTGSFHVSYVVNQLISDLFIFIAVYLKDSYALFQQIFFRSDYMEMFVKRNQCLYEMFCAIWHYLHNLKNVKNTYGGVLLLVKLQAFMLG